MRRQNNKRTQEQTEKGLHARDRKYSFPYRNIEAWNKLDADVINARNIHDFKSKLDNRFGDGTVQAELFYCILQLGKYN